MRSLTLSAAALLAVFSLLDLSGCATVEKDKKYLSLRNTTNGYVKSMRWGYYENALGYLHPDQKKKEEFKTIKEGLRITGYDDVSPPAVVSDDEAIQVILWEYLYEDRQVVKELVDRQTWSWDPDLETWWLTSGAPDFQ